MERRRFLKMAGLTATSGGLAGCSAVEAPIAGAAPLRWRRRVSGTVVGTAADEDAVFVSLRGDGAGACVALDRSTGERRWRRDGLGLAADDRSKPLVAAVAGVVLLSDLTRLVALDPRTGRTAWTAPSVSAFPPIGGDGVVVVTGATDVAAREASSGAVRWRRPADIDGRIPFASAVHGDTYVAASIAGVVEGWSLADGTRRFGVDVDGRIMPFVNALGDGVVYYGTDKNVAPGRIAAVDVARGVHRWTVPTGAGMSVPVTADGALYAGNNRRDGDRWLTEVVRLDAADGAALWEMAREGWPAAADTRGPYLQDAGVVRALSPEGERRWRGLVPVGAGRRATIFRTENDVVVVGPDAVVPLDPATGDRAGRVDPAEDFRWAGFEPAGDVFVAATTAEVFCLAA